MGVTQLYQPAGSNLCGQTCVAMLAGTSIEAVCHMLGKHGSTRTRDIVRALRHYGYRAESRAKRLALGALPLGDGILNYHWSERRMGHWLLYINGHIYDPYFGPPSSTGRATSYIAFSKR